MSSNIYVSIEQDLCTSCGQCPVIEDKIFFMGSDNLAYVRQAGEPEPKSPTIIGTMGMVAVEDALLANVVEAAEYCPGECIYVNYVSDPSELLTSV